MLVNILIDFFNCNNWNPTDEIRDILLDSCLLPAMENTLRSATIIEMGKDTKKY